MSDFSTAATDRTGPARTPETATIGASLYVKGRIEGSDDLVIRGRVEGTVKLPKNRVVIAVGSKVTADVTARSIQVEGHVEGTLKGGHDVTVRAGGQVVGDILAPRVSLDNGARFSGMIDMNDTDSRQAEKRAPKST